MRIIPRTVAVLGALALLAAAGLAAPTTGTQPTASANTLWLHRNSDDAVYWLSNVKDEPAHNDPDPGYNFAGAASADGAGYVWTMPLDPALTGPVQLAADTPIEFNVYLKAITSVPLVGGVPQGAGTGSVETTLTVGGTAIATGEGQDVTLEPDTWAAIKWSIVPSVASLAGDLSWEVKFIGASGGAVLGAADESGWTSLVLPIVGGDSPSVVQETLSGASVDLSHSFSNETTASYRYDWTNALSDPLLTATTNGTGSWTLTVLDNGTQLVQRTFTANGTVTDPLEGAGAGNWTILLNTTAFRGNLALAIEETPAAGGTEPGSGTAGSKPGSGTSTGTGSEGSGTGSGGNGTADEDDGKDTPTLALPLLVGVVALAAVVRRRL